MTKILIGYGTTEGQTAKIADRLAEVMRSHGFEADAVDVKRSENLQLDDYQAVIIGGSIHMGKHQEAVADFVRLNRAVLERLPSAFFSVSLAAHGDTANARRTSRTSSSKRVGIRRSSGSSAALCSIASTDSSSAG
jgi:menaquinone-dependent protoporphyrinogen oxidase